MYHAPLSQIKSVPALNRGPSTWYYPPQKIEINSEEHLNGAMILSLKPKFRGSGQPLANPVVIIRFIRDVHVTENSFRTTARDAIQTSL